MRQSKSMRAKGYTDARAFPGGVAILPSRNKDALRNKAGCVRFLLAQLILLPSLKHTLGTKVGKKCIDNFIFSQTGSKLFSLTVFYHIYSKTLNQCCFPCAVTKIQALTTISMRASWCVTPARAQTEQFTAQRPTNKRFHIYPPPSLGQLRSWMESRVLGGGGVTG